MLGLFVAQGIVFFVRQGFLRFSIMFESAILVVISVVTVFELWRTYSLKCFVVGVWGFIWGVRALFYLQRFCLYLFDEAYINVTSFQMAVGVELLNSQKGVAFIYGFSLICVVLTTASLEDELNTQVSRDPLTNLFNRRALEETAIKAIGLSRRSGRPVMLMDLDRFKAINGQHATRSATRSWWLSLSISTITRGCQI